jgi:hypothetical protein
MLRIESGDSDPRFVRAKGADTNLGVDTCTEASQKCLSRRKTNSGICFCNLLIFGQRPRKWRSLSRLSVCEHTTSCIFKGITLFAIPWHSIHTYSLIHTANSDLWSYQKAFSPKRYKARILSQWRYQFGWYLCTQAIVRVEDTSFEVGTKGTYLVEHSTLRIDLLGFRFTKVPKAIQPKKQPRMLPVRILNVFDPRVSQA